MYLNLRKASVIRVMAILPNSCPSNGWRRGYLTNNCIKEIFDVGETQVFHNCNDKIVTTTPRSSTPRDTATTPKCQEAPRTMCSSQNIRTIPIYPRDPKKIMKFEERKDKTSTLGGLTRATKGLRSKKNPTLQNI